MEKLFAGILRLTMTGLEFVGLTGSLASIILGVVAIWLAVRFYHSSKAAEVEAMKALAELQAQTRLMERLLGRQLERLTAHVTKPAPSVALDPKELAEAIESIKGLAQLQRDSKSQQPRTGSVRVLARYAYWAGQCNVYVQQSVSRMSLALTTAGERDGALATLNESASEFRALLGVISTADDELSLAAKSLELSVRTADEYFDFTRRALGG